MPKSRIRLYKVLMLVSAIFVLACIGSVQAFAGSQKNQATSSQLTIKKLKWQIDKSASVINFWNKKGRQALQLRHEKCWQIKQTDVKQSCLVARRSLMWHTKRLTVTERKLKTLITPADGVAAAVHFLRKAGASESEIQFAISICRRESGCRLNAVNQNSSTGDNSWGPWQINYYGSMYSGRSRFIGSPSTNTESWDRAAKNFLKFLRASGSCNWSPPSYCS